MLKFLADENISRSTINHLTLLGHDVKSVHDYHLTGADDFDVLRKASLSSRIVITQDLDFGNLAVHPVYYSGVIILRLKDQTPANTNRVLESFLNKTGNKRLTHSLAVVSENGYRIRRLKKAL